MGDVIEDIRRSLEGGISLSKSFEKYPNLFDNVYVNLVKAGEASGKLDVFLLKIVDSLEKKEKIKKKSIKKNKQKRKRKRQKLKKKQKSIKKKKIK
jgi:type II secretory pathway component PulF